MSLQNALNWIIIILLLQYGQLLADNDKINGFQVIINIINNINNNTIIIINCNYSFKNYCMINNLLHSPGAAQEHKHKQPPTPHKPHQPPAPTRKKPCPPPHTHPLPGLNNHRNQRERCYIT